MGGKLTVNHFQVSVSCALLSLVFPAVTSAMKTNPLRDFSKLRLVEPTSSSSNTEDYTSGASTTTRTSSPSTPSYGGGYNGDFKPSYGDNQMDSYSEVEPGNNNELYDSNPMMPSMPPPNRPLVHNNDGDESSSSGPNYFNNPQHNPGSNMDKASGGGQNPEDLFFIPQPPSQSFLSEVEDESGISATPEKGMGGLWDGDDEAAGDNPEGGNPEGEGEGAGGGDNPDDYYGNQGGSQFGQENSEDGRRGGYGGGSGSGGGPDGVTERFNSFGGSSDYGDY